MSCAVRARRPWRDLTFIGCGGCGGKRPPGQRSAVASSSGQRLAVRPFNITWIIRSAPLACGVPRGGSERLTTYNPRYVVRPRNPGRGVAAVPGGGGRVIVFSKRQ
ncbi:hypothetical protein ACFFJN_04320 [Erwinia mallotivora]|uniref:hypothetical protein n=1 Tax=Erwinia mallotivora TaxID=69222 RepID=UPI0035ECB1B6